MSQIAILIPAYNICRHLSSLLQELTVLYHSTNIVIVDDGSRDGTTVRLSKRFRQVHFLRHEQNRGKGAALKTGIRYIIDRFEVSAITFMDGDGQHPANSIKDFIAKRNLNKARFIIGARDFSQESMPWPRVVSNTITSFLINLKLQTTITDSQCGFRLLDVYLLITVLPISADGYDFETALLIKAGRISEIAEVKIPTVYADEKSSIRPLRDMIKFVHTYLTT